MSKKWIITLLLLPTLHVGAQSIRLTRYDAPNALYLDFDRLYNFNMYERSRFELGFAWVSPNQNAAHPRKVLGQWTLTPYVAYGTGDHEWKYGLGTQLRLPGTRDVRLCLWGYNDLERAASRRLEGYRMLVQSMNDGIVSSRYVGVKGGGFYVLLRGTPAGDRAGKTLLFDGNAMLGMRQTWEDYRFDRNGLLYPVRNEEDHTTTSMFTEIVGRVDWPFATLSLKGGRMADTEVRYYWQALAQYNADIAKIGLHIFGQVGFASQEAPYSRMFDLSGTAFSLYFFKNSFLTVRPNTFTSNIFAHICLNYTAPLPLWELSWSAPHPFLQLNAMWGHLLGQNENGQRVCDGLPLQAPNQGLLEPATGFDRLIHWGLLDVGFGVAYQICPVSATYLNEDMGDNIAFTIVADFILDKYK